MEEVCSVEKSNEQHMLNPSGDRQWINPSKRLVDRAIERWTLNNLRADNTSVVTVMLDPPGPPRAQVLKKQRELMASTATTTSVTSERGSMALVTNQEKHTENEADKPPGFSIISRYPNAASLRERNLAEATSSRVLHDFQRGQLSRLSNSAKVFNKNAPQPAADSSTSSDTESLPSTIPTQNSNIQCNEVSSSEDEAEEDGDTPQKLRRSKAMVSKICLFLSLVSYLISTLEANHS